MAMLCKHGKTVFTECPQCESGYYGELLCEHKRPLSEECSQCEGADESKVKTEHARIAALEAVCRELVEAVEERFMELRDTSMGPTLLNTKNKAAALLGEASEKTGGSNATS